MINELIEKIKGPKKLSFNHWRYKTLHWAFGINPKAPMFSPLPQCFYTHYCPLFHLTNLIVIFSPFIMMLKFAKSLLRAFFTCCDVTKSIFSKLFKRKEKKRKSLTEEQKLAIKKQEAFEFIREHADYGHSKDVTLELFRIRHFEDLLSDEEFSEYFDKCIKNIERDRKKALKKAEKDLIFKQRLYFWVNFSSSCGKFLINLAYVGLGLISLFAVYNVAYFFLTIPFALILDVAITTMQVSVVLLCLVLLIGILYKIISWLQDLMFSYSHEDKHKDSKLAMTLDLIGSWVKAFFTYVDSKAESFMEFTSVFYENNCPPIVLEEEGKDDDDDNT
jgi:hypothetical protein